MAIWDGPTLEQKKQEIAHQNELLHKANVSGDVGLQAQAKELKADYHAREMAILSDDVYEAADGKKAATPAPVGYTRGSADPAALRAAGINWSDAQIAEYLQPDKSGFRAEIYLPDKAILGPGAKPVLTFKGTDSDQNEDWLNNARQGAGMQSDYYDRAMRVALALNDSLGGDNKRFEITGHSLGGGLASAAAAVTGAHTTTFNSAGLHVDTVPRYMHNKPSFDTNKTVVAYQVSGEVLTGVQTGVANMNALRRAQTGFLAETAAELSRLPGFKDEVTKQIQAHVLVPAKDATAEERASIQMRASKLTGDAKGLIDYLASHSGKQIVDKTPLAAGIVEPTLSAKVRNAKGELVDSPRALTLGNVGELATPIADALTITLAGARAGKFVGDGVALGGRGVGYGLDKTGNTYQALSHLQGKVGEQVVLAGGLIIGGATRGSGSVLATGREALGNLEAAGNRTKGWLMEGVFNASGDWLQEKRADGLAKWAKEVGQRFGHDYENKAQQATAQANADAKGIRHGANNLASAAENSAAVVGKSTRIIHEKVGDGVNAGFDATGQYVRNTTKGAPTVGAVIGATTAGGTVLASKLLAPSPLEIYKTYQLQKYGSQAFSEATNRHLMTETVRPSLDFKIQEREQQLLKSPLMREKQAESKQIGSGVDQKHATNNVQQAPLHSGHQNHEQLQKNRMDTQQISMTETAGLKVLAKLDPRDRHHPDHGLYQQALTGVHQHDAKLGRTPDEMSERMAASLTTLAKENGMNKIDHVVFSVDTGRGVKTGENVIIVQGELGSPAAERTHMKTDVAANTSVHNSFQQLESVNQKQALEVAVQQQSQQQTQQGLIQQPSGGSTMRAMG